MNWAIILKRWPRANPKKLRETDAIFAQVKQINEEADADEQTLRISMDAKATVKVGPFARGGKSRGPTKAADHDFQPMATVTPVGVFLPATDELFFYGVTYKVTSDCLVDRLIDWWGTLEQHWNGSLLDSVDAVIKTARTMTWKGKHPVVELVSSIYQADVKLTKEAMDTLETHLQRLPSLGKWFVDIAYLAPAIRDS